LTAAAAAAAAASAVVTVMSFSAVSSHFFSDDAAAAGITIVGFSMGCLPALACALAFGCRLHVIFLHLIFLIHLPYPPFPHFCSDELPLAALRRVVLFNPATMFWPIWLRPPLLVQDWWTNAPPAAAKIFSYVIKDDPLSEGLPGAHGFRAPIMPGCTTVLPPKHAGADTWKNHNLENFL